MKTNRVVVVAIVAAFCAVASVLAGEAGKSVVLAKADLKWKAMGDSGVAAAPVSGDMEKGPFRFFLKYPAGLVTPLHSHTADHHVTMVSGSITLTVGGKDYRLGRGDYFMLADKAPHAAKVEGSEDAVFYIEAAGPWDVVMAK
ncbi:MAG TPA: cupin domain-containing protein [Opitutaceae bacterium]